MMREITLTRGYKTIIDEADYELVKNYKWRVTVSDGKTYATTWMNGKHVYLHRLLLNFPEGKYADFINGDTLDNRRENLRALTASEKQIGRKAAANNTSGYKGVSFNEKAGKYKAYIRHNGKLIYIGFFSTAKEAAQAYNEKAVELRGLSAFLNSIV